MSRGWNLFVFCPPGWERNHRKLCSSQKQAQYVYLQDNVRSNPQACFQEGHKQKNIYNTEGFIAEVLYLSLNDSLIKRSTFTYLSNKQVGETCFYNGKNELISRTSCQYDKQLNTTDKLVFYILSNKNEKHHFVYEYDKLKNWTSRNEYLNNEVEDIITRKLEYHK